MSLPPGIRRLVTVAVTVLTFVVLLVVGTSVKVPYVALGPGPTVNTLGMNGDKPVVQIEGAQLDKTSGNLNLTTVSVVDGMSLFDSIGKWISGDYTLSPRDRVFPPDQSPEQVRQGNLRDMTDSEDNATLAALVHLNRPTELIVEEVAHDGPAAGVLRKDDVLLSVAGKPVKTTSQVQQVIRGSAPGTPVAMDVRRGTATEHVKVTLGKRPDDPKLGYLGVTPELRNGDPNLKITFNVGDIGGPSAGLMMTLAVIDKLTPGPLNSGKFIAGTGTIDPEGKVGEIGGITHKTRAARDKGATVFLVPAGNCAEAKGDKPDGLELVKVSTLDNALDSLKKLGEGQPLPQC